MIPKSEWYWCGYAGHFVGGARCRFHLSTIVGKYLVSTVGDYYPKTSEARETIGLGRYFETMVFPCDGLDEHLDPKITNFEHIDSFGYQDSKHAENGHHALCEKWASK